MKILVCLKPIQDPAGLAVNRKAQRVFVNREQSVLNPADRSALEAALRLKDSHGAQAIAVSVGQGAGPRGVLLDARALGVDRSILVAGPAAPDGLDEAGVSVVLAALARQLDSVDLVLLGTAALDTAGGQVGPRLAELLGYPFIGPAHSVELSDGRILAVRPRGRGWERATAPLPAVVACPPGAIPLRYPHGAAIMRAYRATDAVEALALSDLGLDEAALKPLTRTLGQSFPPERQPGTRLSGSVDEMAAALVQVLRRDE